MTFEVLERRVDWDWGRQRWGDHGIMFVSPETDRPQLCIGVMTSPGGAFERDTYAYPDRFRYRMDVEGD